MIEADPASRRLLIRNVGFNTTEETLYKSLEAYGEIDDFKLVCDRQSGMDSFPKAPLHLYMRSMSFLRHSSLHFLFCDIRDIVSLLVLLDYVRRNAEHAESA